MCEHGTTVDMLVKVSSELSHSGADEWKVKPVDSCIAPIVRALQDGGIDMLGSCCGHGKGHGSILLADGRELRIGRPS